MNKKDYIKDRYARRGSLNPEPYESALWQKMAETGEGPYGIGQRMRMRDFTQPRWTFDRFGQSQTDLPDGRTVWIAGEHEDYYDPDFFIYNDVTIETDGTYEFFLYPEKVFPPTDFHSATLVDDVIFVIGSLGYSGTRRPGATQVLTLDTRTWAFTSPPEQSGENPGWIYKHDATFDGEWITIRGGHRETESSTAENFDDYRFNVASGLWEKLTDRNYTQFEIARCDGKANHLWNIRQSIFSQSMGWVENYDREIATLKEDLKEIRVDAVEAFYSPPFAHRTIEMTEDEYNVYRFEVEDVVVRHVEETWTISVVVEGELSPELVESWKEMLVSRLSEIEEAPCEARDV